MKHIPAGPGRQLPLQVGFTISPSRPLRMPLLMSTAALSLWKTDPSHAGPSPPGSEEPVRDKGPPDQQLLSRPHPHPFLWPGSSVVAAPSSCLFHLPRPPSSALHPSPTINENQEGEWGLERVIPFVFMGLRRRTRGKECGLSPEARSRPLTGGWVPVGLGL